jgi:hypothetical protein
MRPKHRQRRLPPAPRHLPRPLHPRPSPAAPASHRPSAQHAGAHPRRGGARPGGRRRGPPGSRAAAARGRSRATLRAPRPAPVGGQRRRRAPPPPVRGTMCGQRCGQEHGRAGRRERRFAVCAGRRAGGRGTRDATRDEGEGAGEGGARAALFDWPEVREAVARRLPRGVAAYSRRAAQARVPCFQGGGRGESRPEGALRVHVPKPVLDVPDLPAAPCACHPSRSAPSAHGCARWLCGAVGADAGAKIEEREGGWKKRERERERERERVIQHIFRSFHLSVERGRRTVPRPSALSTSVSGSVLHAVRVACHPRAPAPPPQHRLFRSKDAEKARTNAEQAGGAGQAPGASCGRRRA